MDMEILTAEEMRARLKVSRETFRKTWRNYLRISVGTGGGLRSARFLWDDKILMEQAYGRVEIQDEKGNPLQGRNLPGRSTNRQSGRVQKQAGRTHMGGGTSCADIELHAKRFGLI